ncbi:hypothetical protein [Niabella ginsenosidivorans]|nr:hypothetical protein [Niabella ginsenosidivorans]
MIKKRLQTCCKGRLKTGLLLLLPVLLIHVANAQAQMSADTVQWNSLRKLTWNDFKGEAMELPGLKGEIYCFLPATYQRDSVNAKTVFFVQAVFDKKGSWIQKTSKTPLALQYYQVYFDLFELHARKLRGQLAAVQPDADPTQAFQQIYNTQFNMLNDDLKALRKETKLGVVASAVAAWKSKTEKALTEMAAYAGVEKKP